MSKSEILYVKGMNMVSESEEDDNMNSAWDDRKLTDAYDKALKIANAEVAKRVAMSTNTGTANKEENMRNKNDKQPSHGSSTRKKLHQWRAGMPCRSVYEADGYEYEAFVLRIINDEECVVRYLGYENTEIVAINTLKPTHGNDERKKQIELAVKEKADEGFGSQSPNQGDDVGASDRVPSPDCIVPGQSTTQKKKRSCKKKKSYTSNNFQLPEMPMMPDLSMLRNAATLEMPMPPPPLAFASSRTDSEEQAISSMLLSWYMSGYYTGLYQGLKRSKDNNNQ